MAYRILQVYVTGVHEITFVHNSYQQRLTLRIDFIGLQIHNKKGFGINF
jgi:hypothetical protein